MIDVSVSSHHVGDCRVLLKKLPTSSIQTCVTSPPFWGLRDYGHQGQIGLEATPKLYVKAIVNVLRLVRRVLRDDGTVWLNLGDSRSGSRSGPQGEMGEMGEMANRKAELHRSVDRRAKNRPDIQPTRGAIGLKRKNLIGIPWKVAFALQDDGWYLRSDIVWHKPNAAPESVRDRPTTNHEYLFLLSKKEHYYYDADAIREEATGRLADEYGTRNARTVWSIPTVQYDGAHFAVMAPKVAERCVLAGSCPGDLVLDPFFGSGTTGQVAEKHGRRWVGFDLGYEELAKARTAQRSLVLPATPKEASP